MVDPATLAAPGFPRIADYGMLSDGHTGALVAPDGTIEWLCVPRFDSPSIFAAILDRAAGRFRFGPRETVPVARRYAPGTNVLETTWATETGWLVVRDALTIGPWRERSDDPHSRPPPDLDAERVLVRVAECVQGEVEVELLCRPVADYGRGAVDWELDDRQTSGDGHRRRDRRPAPALDQRPQPRGRAASDGGPPQAGRRGALLLRALLGRTSPCRRSRSRTPRPGSTRPASTGAAGWSAAPFPTTRGGSTCSARR